MATISEKEKLDRRQSNEDVLGSHAMEGIFPDEVTRNLMDRFAEGQLSREEMSKQIDLHVQKLLSAKGKLVGAA